MKGDKVLGIDMGANSIGWFAQIIGDDGFTEDFIGGGARIFDNSRDPKTKVPLSVQRRMTKSASIRRDRMIMRTRNLCAILRKYGLLPKEKGVSVAGRNPYRLRAKAVHEKTDLLGIGRAILHINKRRGFKSNRKADRKADEGEVRGMKLGISKLKEALAGKTLGEFLYERKKSGLYTRMRAKAVKNKNEYEIYADREMYESEFRRIWSTQQKFHKNLTDEMGDEIFNALFFQRPLKVPERGFCQFEIGERRAYKAYPVSQKFRILQEVNALEIADMGNGGCRIEPADRKKLAQALLSNNPKVVNKSGVAAFSKIKTFLGIPKSLPFNFESENRKGFEGDSTAAIMGAERCFGNLWNSIDDAMRERIVDLVMQNREEEFAQLASEKFGFDCRKSSEIMDCAMDLKEGTVSLSSLAMHKIMKHLEDGALYHLACSLAGYDFNANYTGEILESLPYYGKILNKAVLGGNPKFDAEKDPERHYGKINNPTVHVALNQLRKLVNKFIEVYGKPDRIVIETARNLPLGEKGLAELAKEQSSNRKKNEEIAGKLKELGVSNSASNRMKFKLWEDLNPDPLKRCCPFCGRQIEMSKLFTSEFEVEHLLPFSETFDDSRANKVVSCVSCNRVYKGKRSPYEAFFDREGFDWQEILARASALPRSKQWRFLPNAREIFEEKYGDFIQRMLNDTRYMSKLAREYLTSIVPPENIITVPGSVTAKLRSSWGLNAILDDVCISPEEAKKNREDHRHHAVDAFVISCVNRKLVAEVSKCAKRAEEAHLENLLKALPSPFLRVPYEKFSDIVKAINVSHKLDRGDARNAVAGGGSAAKLHNDTAYGKIGRFEEHSEKITIAKRVPLSGIECDPKSISQIANPKIRRELIAICDELMCGDHTEKEKKAVWQKRILDYCAQTHVRRVRIHIPNREMKKLIPIADKTGRIYKYMENAESYCIDIFKPSKSEKWGFQVINMFEAHRGGMPDWRRNDPRAKLVMRLFKRDTIAYEESGEYKLAVVKGIAANGQISIVPLSQGKIEGNPPTKKPSVLQKLNARKVYVDELGRVFDPHVKQS